MNSYPGGTPPPPGGNPAAGQSSSVAVRLPYIKPLATYWLIGITSAIYVLEELTQNVLGVDLPVVFGVKIDAAIRAGQIWRLITPVFLHDPASILHLLFNMYALYVLGKGVEPYYGHTRFLVLYFLGGFAGNVFSFLFSPAASLGASTAIFGLLGAEGVFIYHNRKFFGNRYRAAIGNVLFFAALNFVIGLAPNIIGAASVIDNWGHLGGLIGGTLFAWFAGPIWNVEGLYPSLHLVDSRGQRDIQIAGLSVGLLFSALVVVGMFLG